MDYWYRLLSDCFHSVNREELGLYTELKRLFADKHDLERRKGKNRKSGAKTGAVLCRANRQMHLESIRKPLVGFNCENNVSQIKQRTTPYFKPSSTLFGLN